MDGSIDWDSFDLIEDKNDCPNLPTDRKCPRCGTAVSGRPNRVYCSSNCRKRHTEGKRNATFSMAKRRENAELYDRAKRLTERLYLTPPMERLGFMKDLIDIARAGSDAQLRDILSPSRVFSGKTRGIDSGRSVQSRHLQTSVVTQNPMPCSLSVGSSF